MTARRQGARSGQARARSANVRGGSGDQLRGTWCTPSWLAELIGPVDLDPCSNARSHIRAATALMFERGEDGLAAATTTPPDTSVFINPPYEHGSVARWIAAYRHTRFVFLLRFDPSTEWFAQLYATCELVAIPRGRRVNFEPPPGVRASSQTFPHALFYRFAADAPQALLRACIAWRKRSSATA